ncbi:carbohydrate ABC transporter permease [Granulosicoccus sp. 3-233]|uniref:carbohydrate ABC transporter permease n=1 Tax=Granulosicoccus sp. 3-233 TaxID=3417969 RepID=UPI003D358694
MLKSLLDNDRTFRYLLVIPAVFFILLIGLYPFIKLVIASFQNISLFDDVRSFQGLLNYERLLSDDRLWQSLVRTLVFTAVALPIELVLGYLLAALFLEKIPFKAVLISIILLPTIISPIVAGATWRLMLDQRFGPVNQIISWLAGTDVKLLWTVSANLVWPAILIAEVWQWTPFMFLLLYAALSNVDREQLEAAQIDGASWWMTFRRIVLPAIMPVMFIAVLIRALDLFRVFDLVWTMTQGGPGTATETLSIYAYQMAFREFEISYSAAIAFLVIVLLTVFVVAALRRVEVSR